MTRFVALVPAAGSGSRMGAQMPKQYLPLLERPLLAHTLDALAAADSIDQVVLVLSAGDEWFDPASLTEPGRAKLCILRCGGDSRAATVRHGLRALVGEVGPDDWILVHDAARPCLHTGDIATLIDCLRDDPVGGILAIPVADTLKRGGADERIAATVPREALWRAQTPQMFRHGMLLAALERAGTESVTDEASAIEALGLAPRLVRGREQNIKVTYPEDMALAALFLRQAKEAQ